MKGRTAGLCVGFVQHTCSFVVEVLLLPLVVVLMNYTSACKLLEHIRTLL